VTQTKREQRRKMGGELDDIIEEAYIG